MDLFFFALESPLFPGALLALFFALAARAMTLEPEVALETAHTLRPAPRKPAFAKEPVPEPVPAREPESATIYEVPSPSTTFDFDRIAQSASDETVELEVPAICYDSHDAPTDPEIPIRWL